MVSVNAFRPPFFVMRKRSTSWTVAKDWSSQLSKVNFRCGRCKSAWTAVPDLIEEDAAAEHHPWRYFANCQRCDAEHRPQAG